jgi:hypothetical protein
VVSIVSDESTCQGIHLSGNPLVRESTCQGIHCQWNPLFSGIHLSVESTCQWNPLLVESIVSGIHFLEESIVTGIHCQGIQCQWNTLLGNPLSVESIVCEIHLLGNHTPIDYISNTFFYLENVSVLSPSSLLLLTLSYKANNNFHKGSLTEGEGSAQLTTL